LRDRNSIVFDVGKTHAKLTLWSPEGVLIRRSERPNALIDAGHYRALDSQGIEAWAVGTLAEFATLGRVGTIIPVAHGAAAAVVRNGRLACAVLDYEQMIPDDIRSRYDRLRDSFQKTGSPALPNGLNLGAQLYWLDELIPELRSADSIIVPWAQYWAWVLSGVLASEITSLGCHTDLWCPMEARPSALAIRCRWDERLAPLRRADEVLGELRPELVARTGLPADTQVLCGLHDSNAALLAARGFGEIAAQDSTVVSTGTWFVAMRSPADRWTPESSRLAEQRDCLINVDAFGHPVPSARFMGGRELELLTAEEIGRLDHAPDQERILAAATRVVSRGTMTLPTLTTGSGPYPHARHQWLEEPANPDERRAASGVYAALVLSTSLSLIGARGAILVEGRFADAKVFVRALAALHRDAAVYVSHSHNGVPYGALRLVNPALTPPARLEPVVPLAAELDDYAGRWRAAADRLEGAG
jgi:sugar (pentulose or hexulose) kinase